MAHDMIAYPSAQKDDRIYEFSESEKQEIAAHVAKYPAKESAIMPALWIAQEKFGWLPDGAIKLVAETLGVPYAQVYGVATFYTMYLKHPMVFNDSRTHLVEICTCFTCGVCDGLKLFEWAHSYLKCDEKGYSADKKIFLREAECLGACDTAVVAQIDNRRIAHKLTETRLKEIFEMLRQDQELPYEQIPLYNQNNIS
jgi:NADH-quinone oxidoreductase subunit E